MRRAYTLLILGIWVAILPFLGFPISWKNILFVLTGLGLMYFSFMIYKDALKKGEVANQIFDNFSENKFVNEEEA
jgi:Na+/phosphate symporter